MYGLTGKTAIVTGAAHGIGKAIATRLLKEGCAVGIFDFDPVAAEATVEALKATTGGTVALAIGDVSKGDEVGAGVAALKATLGAPIDILVNNAGICRLGKVLETTESEWRAHFAVNADGIFHTTRAVAPEMVERRAGAIVNIASWMSKQGAEAYGAYCASKAAAMSITQTLALELAETGVRVNAVAPGLIVETKMRDESELLRRQQGLPTAQDRAKSIPLRRAGVPEDIAKAVLFLASDEAAYITGETINITGGMYND
ncbi:SDR family NAD(P)-dependent oxidoreductase [Acuticoccus kandeliae]|uniref:SDR family NAD(P)-dependent oxidoreductase n=1 Tax=Acuticoccus kandeliae TaxID=2073160 RepID=UPI000D3E630F|nr:SDR family NAD(P)-dependent oxidoreductase [Acuticoccus kandeliae]